MRNFKEHLCNICGTSANNCFWTSYLDVLLQYLVYLRPGLVLLVIWLIWFDIWETFPVNLLMLQRLYFLFSLILQLHCKLWFWFYMLKSCLIFREILHYYGCSSISILCAFVMAVVGRLCVWHLFLRYLKVVSATFLLVCFVCLKEHLRNKEKCFLFHFKSSSRSWDNQLLTFLIFKFHDVIKCPSMKHETYYWITWEVNAV